MKKFKIVLLTVASVVVAASVIVIILAFTINSSECVETFDNASVVGITNFTPFVKECYDKINQFGNGEKKNTEKCNNDDQIGVKFDSAGLTDLPLQFPNNTAANNKWMILKNETSDEVEVYCCGEEKVFQYASIAPTSKFKHLLMNYLPEDTDNGWAPTLGFHWYFITNEQRESKSAVSANYKNETCYPNQVVNFGEGDQVTCEDLARCRQNVTDKDNFPGGVDSELSCSGCWTSMGNHCSKGPYDEKEDKMVFTVIDGIIDSNEPVIPISAWNAAVEAGEEICRTFDVPKVYEFEDGCYPTTYCYGCSDDVCKVYLTDYVHLST